MLFLSRNLNKFNIRQYSIFKNLSKTNKFIFNKHFLNDKTETNKNIFNKHFSNDKLETNKNIFNINRCSKYIIIFVRVSLSFILSVHIFIALYFGIIYIIAFPYVFVVCILEDEDPFELFCGMYWSVIKSIFMYPFNYSKQKNTSKDNKN